LAGTAHYTQIFILQNMPVLDLQFWRFLFRTNSQIINKTYWPINLNSFAKTQKYQNGSM
jgi:hypothetical protein